MKTHTMNPGGKGAAHRDSSQSNPGENSEIRFLTEMIDHHSMAVQMSEALVNETDRPELKQLCRNIITSQRDEIQQMQRWLREWHGIEHDVKHTNVQMRH
jgi:uncharacterized protein (DUF305 family)